MPLSPAFSRPAIRSTPATPSTHVPALIGGAGGGLGASGAEVNGEDELWLEAKEGAVCPHTTLHWNQLSREKAVLQDLTVFRSTQKLSLHCPFCR